MESYHQKKEKIEKKGEKKARIAVIKAANKKKAKLNKQEKKVLDKRISKTEQKDGEDTEKAGNTSDSQSDEKKIIKKKAPQNISHCST